LAKSDENLMDNINTLVTEVQDVEEFAIIVKLDGWRMRAYFDESIKPEDKEKYSVGQMVELSYTGSLDDIFSVNLLKIEK